MCVLPLVCDVCSACGACWPTLRWSSWTLVWRKRCGNGLASRVRACGPPARLRRGLCSSTPVPPSSVGTTGKKSLSYPLPFVPSAQAFVKLVDYQGIQFVKRLRRLDDKVKQRAEVAVYFQRFDEAETLYRDIDRKDLAIELRMRLGDWLRVVQLLQVRLGPILG
jgi:hypothetical protein